VDAPDKPGHDNGVRGETLSYYVYILANKPYGTLYIGVTNDLVRRVYEHRTAEAPSFTKRYDIRQLVYFESTENVEAAIHREKRIKKWRREWKINLIERGNPDWHDLYAGLAV
jgi:putative endonuclease